MYTGSDSKIGIVKHSSIYIKLKTSSSLYLPDMILHLNLEQNCCNGSTKRAICFEFPMKMLESSTIWLIFILGSLLVYILSIAHLFFVCVCVCPALYMKCMSEASYKYNYACCLLCMLISALYQLNQTFMHTHSYAISPDLGSLYLPLHFSHIFQDQIVQIYMHTINFNQIKV